MNVASLRMTLDSVRLMNKRNEFELISKKNPVETYLLAFLLLFDADSYTKHGNTFLERSQDNRIIWGMSLPLSQLIEIYAQLIFIDQNVSKDN